METVRRRRESTRQVAKKSEKPVDARYRLPPAPMGPLSASAHSEESRSHDADDRKDKGARGERDLG